MPGSRPAPQAGALAGVRTHPTQGAQTALPPTSFACSRGRCEGLPGIPAMMYLDRFLRTSRQFSGVSGSPRPHSGAS